MKVHHRASFPLFVFLCVAVTAGPVSATAVLAQLDMRVPGFDVELVTTLPAQPLSLAIAPFGSPYGAGTLFVGATSPVSCNCDVIYRVDSSGAVAVFAQLERCSSPVGLEFPPTGSPFGTSLYVAANNSDDAPCDGADCGGTIQVVDPLGAWVDFTRRVGGPNTVGCSAVAELTEPCGLAFGTGANYFGTDMYVANSTNPPGSVMRVFPHTFPSVEIPWNGQSATTVHFGPGGAFGEVLYIGDYPTATIRRYDGAVLAPFAQLPVPAQQLCALEFGGGAFGSKLYVTTLTALYTVDPQGVIQLFAEFAPGHGGWCFDNLEFAPDNAALLVSDRQGGTICRIVPKKTRRR